MRGDLKELATRTKEELKKSYSNHGDKSCYKVVLQCADHVETKLSNAGSAGMIDFDVLDENEMECAIRDLLALEVE